MEIETIKHSNSINASVFTDFQWVSFHLGEKPAIARLAIVASPPVRASIFKSSKQHGQDKHCRGPSLRMTFLRWVGRANESAFVHSERSASAAFTRAARAAGKADAIAAAARITKADEIKVSIPGRCTSATYLPVRTVPQRLKPLLR